jgi:hypothetical protein
MRFRPQVVQLEDRCTPSTFSFQFSGTFPLPPAVPPPAPINIHISENVQLPSNPNLPQETLSFNFTAVAFQNTPQTIGVTVMGSFSIAQMKSPPSNPT